MPFLRLFLASLCLGCATFAAPTPIAPSAIPIGEIDAEQLAPVMGKFDELVGAGAREVTFLVHSPGGSVFAGLEFLKHVGMAKKAHGVHVTCFVDYMAASMAFVTLQDICDTRLATPRSIFLAHNSSGGHQGTVKEVRRGLAIPEALDLALSAVAGARLTIGVDGYRKKVADGDWVFGAEEALAVGAIDGVVGSAAVPVPFELEAVK